MLKTHIAKRKDHRCTECGRRIPIKARYFSDEGGDIRVHTNCLNFENEEILPDMYNFTRPKK